MNKLKIKLNSTSKYEWTETTNEFHKHPMFQELLQLIKKTKNIKEVIIEAWHNNSIYVYAMYADDKGLGFYFADKNHSMDCDDEPHYEISCWSKKHQYERFFDNKSMIILMRRIIAKELQNDNNENK